MGSLGSGKVFPALIAELRRVDPFEKRFSRTEKNRRDRHVHLIDQSGAKVLPDCSRPAAQSDILTFRSFLCSLQCGVNAIGDQVEGRASTHLDRRAWVVGAHKHGGWYGGLSPYQPFQSLSRQRPRIELEWKQAGGSTRTHCCPNRQKSL